MPTSSPSLNSKPSPLLSQSDLTVQQEDMITALYEGNRLVIAQAGAGKTVCSQTAAQELIDDDVLSRVIIFAPLKVCQLTWLTEWVEWEHLRQPLMAIGDAPRRRDAVLDMEAPLVIMNLDNMAWFFTEFGRDHGFDGIIIDEISKLKDPGTAAFKKLRHHIKDFEWRVGLSATPVHEAATDIYTQVMFCDGGKALGKNREKFLRKYFMQMDYQGYKWDFQPGGEARLAADIGDLVFVADTTEYEAGLPALEDVIVPVKMGDEAWMHYDAMSHKLLTEIEDKEVEAPNLAVLQGKLQQICCGAVYDLERNPVWIHKEKFAQLTELVGRWQEPVVIVYQFQYELDMLKAMYDRALVLGDDPAGAQAAWNSGECDILLIHPKSAGHGINIQFGGCRMVWMSPVWSADQWDQTIRRLLRRGQPSDVVWRYTLLVEGSVERLILERHDEKMAGAASFIDHLKEHAA